MARAISASGAPDIPPDPAASPIFDEAELADLASFGSERPVTEGKVLFRAGDASEDLYVVLEGEVQVRRSGGGREEAVVAAFGPGTFVGELTLLTGQRRFLTAVVSRSGRLLVIGAEELRSLMGRRPALSDRIFGAMVARRERLRHGVAAGAISIIGSRFCPQAMSLREFADHARVPYTWLDLEDADVADSLEPLGLSRRDTPAVVTPTEILRRATAASFAEHLGLTYVPVPGYVFDLVVVGSGPAGLAAAVYGASEGLRTVSLDASGVGGQAGASSRIENYMGFPKGISGGDLTARAAAQAMRLGARLNGPCEVVALRSEPGFRVLTLADGSEIPARAVVVATGARYRRLAVDGLSRFEGAGVYYAATDREAAVCAGGPALVVGGGNSAGQAAIYLRQRGCPVAIAIRGGELSKSMSRYLVERIEAEPGIEVLRHFEVRGLEGRVRLERATLRHNGTGEERTLPLAGLFSFIGAEPAVAWLGEQVARDRSGFVLTDRDLPADPAPGGDGPLAYETSLPGVFAAGDVRSGSMKRVAAAVGEGSSAVRSVYARVNAAA